MDMNKKLLITGLLTLVMAGGAYAVSPEANYLYQQACSAEYKEDYATAVQKLTEALKIAPNDVMIYTKLAGVYSEMGEYDKASEKYGSSVYANASHSYLFDSYSEKKTNAVSNGQFMI